MDHHDPLKGLETTEDLLSGLATRTNPSTDAHHRVKARIAQRISHPDLFTELRRALSPDPHMREKVWSHIAADISLVPKTLWDRLRASLEPMDHVRERILMRISPRLVPVPVHARPLKWIAAVAVFVLLATSSPLFFLARPTLADSPVSVSGDVYMLGNGLWQQPRAIGNEAFRLQTSAILQTGEGGGKITVHDDFIVRMAPHTTIALHDLADRPGPRTYANTMTLHEGTVWVQSFVPESASAVRVVVGDARILIHDGSVSMTSGGSVDVWNRHVILETDAVNTKILAGQRVALDGSVDVSAIPLKDYDATWVTSNLASDAVHRLEISQLQRERRAARAGILPGSIFYGAKRTAERVSVALSFDPETKTRKLLDLADARLNEAAALLNDDQAEAAETSLNEYRETVLEATTESDVSQAIVQRELADDRADLAAALPGDVAYVLTDTIQGTKVAVFPEEKTAVEQEQLADHVQAVNVLVAQGNVDGAESALQEITQQLTEQEASPAVREAAASLSVSATALQPDSSVIQEVVDQVTLPELRYPAPRIALSDADRMSLVGLILGRWQSVTSPVSICNEMVLALRQIAVYDAADSAFIIGRILRDAPEPLAGQFRSILVSQRVGQEIVCSGRGQPPERTF